MSLKKIVALFTAIALVAGIATVPVSAEEQSQKLKIAMLIPGNEKDNGFMEAAYRGFVKIKENLPVEITYISNVSQTSDEKVLTDAMKNLAKAAPDMIIAHGGQCSVPAKAVAQEYPDIKFVVIQGNVMGDNLSSYTVNQEQSAWLAGALAGLSTKTNVVGHLSGAWPAPGQRARAAFYDGLMHTNPDAKFVTHFSGNLDDKAINKKAAQAEIDAGADVIYTMLNGGRVGANEAVAESDGAVREIGNVIDWTKVDDSVFIGSAVADASVAIYNAANELVEGTWQPGQISEIGLERSDVVDIAIADGVDGEIVQQINKYKQQIIDGEIVINTTYKGDEFDPDTGEFVAQSYKEEQKKLREQKAKEQSKAEPKKEKITIDGRLFKRIVEFFKIK